MLKYEETANQLKNVCYMIHHGNGNAYISKFRSEHVDKALNKEDGIYREAFWVFSDAKKALLDRQRQILDDARDHMRIIKEIQKSKIDWE